MKRIALFLAVLMLVFSLAACGGETAKQPETVAGTTEPTVATEETTEAVGECKHQYEQEIIDEANCLEKGSVQHTCSICKNSYTEEVPAVGHQSSGTSCVDASVCEKCGEILEKAQGHEVVDGTCVHCGEEIAE